MSLAVGVFSRLPRTVLSLLGPGLIGAQFPFQFRFVRFRRRGESVDAWTFRFLKALSVGVCVALSPVCCLQLNMFIRPGEVAAE